MSQDRGGKLWRCLRPGLYAHTAQALAAMPVSAPIPNANYLNHDFSLWFIFNGVQEGFAVFRI